MLTFIGIYECLTEDEMTDFENKEEYTKGLNHLGTIFDHILDSIKYYDRRRYRSVVKKLDKYLENLEKEDILKELFEISAMLRNIERAGDHVKNICEHVLYMMKGQHYDFG